MIIFCTGLTIAQIRSKTIKRQGKDHNYKKAKTTPTICDCLNNLKQKCSKYIGVVFFELELKRLSHA
jgi:hypothetical protein